MNKLNRIVAFFICLTALISGSSLYAMDGDENEVPVALFSNTLLSWLNYPVYLGVRVLSGALSAHNDSDEFLDACTKGDLAKVKAMLRDDFDSEANLRSFFNEACLRGHLAVVQALLADARFNQFRSYVLPLRFAIEEGFEDIALLLLDKNLDLPVNADGDSSALFVAAELGRLRMVRILLADQRFDHSALNDRAFVCAVCKGHANIVELLLKDPKVNPKLNPREPSYAEYGPNFALIVAAEKGFNDIIKLLLIDGRLRVEDIPPKPKFLDAIVLIKSMQQELASLVGAPGNH